MAWKTHEIEAYAVSLMAGDPGFTNKVAYINLFWGGEQRVNLIFYSDDTHVNEPNVALDLPSGPPSYTGRFAHSQYAAMIDLLRNEKPCFFHWDETAKRIMVSTGPEPVGEGEAPG